MFRMHYRCMLWVKFSQTPTILSYFVVSILTWIQQTSLFPTDFLLFSLRGIGITQTILFFWIKSSKAGVMLDQQQQPTVFSLHSVSEWGMMGAVLSAGERQRLVGSLVKQAGGIQR